MVNQLKTIQEVSTNLVTQTQFYPLHLEEHQAVDQAVVQAVDQAVVVQAVMHPQQRHSLRMKQGLLQPRGRQMSHRLSRISLQRLDKKRQQRRELQQL